LAQDFRPQGDDPPGSVVHLITALQLWRRARSIGRLAVVRKSQTIAGLGGELRRCACGTDWSTLLDGPNALARQLERAQAGVGGSPGFGSRMRTTAWGDMSWSRLRVEFFNYAQHYNITKDRGLTEQALTLAFRPWALRISAGESPVEVLTKLLACRPLVRGAFLARAAMPTSGGVLAA
jgi:hypothetical protein